MTTYSVAEAKNTLPRLLDRALEGEQVIITRHGKPVAEIRPLTARTLDERRAAQARFAARRKARPPLGMTAVELLNSVYDEPRD